jgi:putative PIN family toxin of toxin-antitoxin system
VVFDTNTVISSLLFSQGRLAWLRDAWRTQRLIPLVSEQTVSELLRVLAYPKFGLDPEDRIELLGDYLPFAEVITLSQVPEDLPECRDPFDQPFLELASIAAAEALVTGDHDILELKDALPFEVLTPMELMQRLGLGVARG